MKPKVLVIVGPTASGKSDLAVRLAKKFNGEVISADSRQVYKGLDVGSGKITKKEMCKVPHYLLDVISPKKQFTTAQYNLLASKSIEGILGRGKLPIIVGGTGFYIDTLMGSDLPDVPPNQELRDKLSKKTPEYLFALLKKKDSQRAKNIDKNNKVRLIRALEIVDILGKVPKIKKSHSKFKPIYIGIKPNKDELDRKIYIRLVRRLPGIVREIKKLHKEGISWKRMYELGLEYRYVSLYARKKLSKKEMTEKLYSEIRHYAKRQMTWFKRNKDIVWFESPKDKKITDYLSFSI